MKAEHIVQILHKSTGADKEVAQRITVALFSELAAQSAEMIAAGYAAASRRLIDVDRQDIEEIWRAMTGAAVGTARSF